MLVVILVGTRQQKVIGIVLKVMLKVCVAAVCRVYVPQETIKELLTSNIRKEGI